MTETAASTGTMESAKWPEWPMELEDMTVLFVDDEENVLHSLRRTLRNEPYEIITHSSAAEGLETLKSREIQMIVSDECMPEISGIEFLEKARVYAPDSIRVMLTGHGNLETARNAINRAQIFRFLNKPWDEEDLKATIRQGLTEWQLKRANEAMMKVIEEQNKKLLEFNRDLGQLVEERTRQLKETEACLVQSEKMGTAGLLAGGVAHEINNPLSGILILARLLRTDFKDNGQALEDLQTIEKAVLRCKDIINNLLSYSRQDQKKDKVAVIVPELIKNSLDLIGHLLRESKIEVVQEYAPDLPSLPGNPNQLEQVIINLLTNAQQAMKSPGTITVRGKKLGAGLMIEVEDQGEGIPEQVLPKVFDPFFTTKDPGKGTGLGLFVSYGIVRNQGGRIEIESEVGKGTKVKLIFDRKEIK